MFSKILTFILLIDAVILMVAVLLQAGKGGGLAASFGGASAGDALFGARQAGNLLTKTTWWSAGVFLFIAFVMQIMSTRSSGPTSVLDQSFAPAPAVAPAPAAESVPAGAPLKALPLTPEPAKKQP